ncbi:MAG TPA: response regulator [Longimicrobiales bacterium]|nr:response regulator [Longimicrobiales bacterium]
MARIIVIEDEAAIRRLINRILARSGHEVREAKNGRDGVALHRDDPADLVITDVFMPEQDGIETIRQIREFAPDTPIIAMSGGGARGGGDSLESAQAIGAQAVMQKPFSPDELERVVRALLGAQSPRLE